MRFGKIKTFLSLERFVSLPSPPCSLLTHIEHNCPKVSNTERLKGGGILAKGWILAVLSIKEIMFSFYYKGSKGGARQAVLLN